MLFKILKSCTIILVEYAQFFSFVDLNDFYAAILLNISKCNFVNINCK